MSRIPVVLVEDHEMVRAGIRALLAAHADVDVVGEAGAGQDALDLVARTGPAVVLLDLSLPGLHGLEVLDRIVQSRPTARVLVLSMHRDEQYVARALQRGAAGYLPKDATSQELITAIRQVARGGRYVSERFSREAVELHLNRSHTSPLEALTPRQREVLQLVAEGHTTRAIAARLGISVKTVEVHRSHIMERLDIHEVASLARFAVAHGLVSLRP